MHESSELWKLQEERTTATCRNCGNCRSIAGLFLLRRPPRSAALGTRPLTPAAFRQQPKSKKTSGEAQRKGAGEPRCCTLTKSLPVARIAPSMAATATQRSSANGRVIGDKGIAVAQWKRSKRHRQGTGYVAGAPESATVPVPWMSSLNIRYLSKATQCSPPFAAVPSQLSPPLPWVAPLRFQRTCAGTSPAAGWRGRSGSPRTAPALQTQRDGQRCLLHPT